MVLNTVLGLAKSKSLVMETRYIWQTYFYREYILILLVFIFLFLIWFKRKQYRNIKNKEVVAIFGFLFFLGLSIYMVRFIIFLLPFFYIVMGMLMEEKDLKYLFIGAFIAMVLFSAPVYFRETIMNDGIYDAVTYLNNENPKGCLVGDWGKGHIYRYYYEGTVRFSAHPDEFVIQGMLEYMVYGNRTGCSLIWTERDYLALEFLLSDQNINISKEDYYITKLEKEAEQFKYKNKTYWVVV